MKYFIFFIFILLSLSGCGGDGNKKSSEKEQITSSTNTTQTTNLSSSLSTLSEDINKTADGEKSEIIAPIADKVITLYLHGYNQDGYKKDGIYGVDDSLEENAEVANFLGFSTLYEESSSELGNNILVATPYYGNQAPDYYTDQDIKDIENIGIGIPRYALIAAKYAKYIMKKSGAQKINILSVSMGSLVARYMIEKNLETIASDKKITRWLSLEGVIQGNYAASSKNLVEVVNIFEKQSPDVEHMSYKWIEKNLGSRAIGNSPYYKDIIVGFETSTKDDALEGILSIWMTINDKFRPNDGYQIARDTYFKIDNIENMPNNLPPTHTYFHNNHIDLADNKSAWVQAVSFLTSKKRVKITLTKATVNDIHEDREKIKVLGKTIGSHNFKPAEIVFASTITSPKANDLWSIKDPIDERVLSGGALSIYQYENNGDTKIVNQELFNDFVIPSEDMLSLNINAYEIDRYAKYNMHELTGQKTENLGGETIEIPLQNGTHRVSTEDWNGEVKVEVFNY